MKQHLNARRNFIKTSAALSGAFLLNGLPGIYADAAVNKTIIPVYAHLWVYASRYPPDWDCTPIMDTVFSELKYAGLQGVEVMEIHLRHEDAVNRFKELIDKYSLPVTGASYYGDMWDKAAHQKLEDDIELITERLHLIGANMLGITVGDAKHVKTEDELDAQADFLQKVIAICNKHDIQPNLHNHTFEVVNDMHDLKGTLARIPGILLGPDLNWLVRGGVDPVWFIKTYGHQMVYMHIRDQDSSGTWTEAVGEGITDFPAIVQALKAVNYNGKAAIELAFDKPPVHPVKEDWKKSREYVKKVFGW